MMFPHWILAIWGVTKPIFRGRFLVPKMGQITNKHDDIVGRDGINDQQYGVWTYLMCVGKWGGPNKNVVRMTKLVINHCFLGHPMFKPAGISSFQARFKIG